MISLKIFNRLDDILENIISLLKNNALIFDKDLKNVLEITSHLLKQKSPRNYYNSYDFIIEIIYFSADLEIISLCLIILSRVFSQGESDRNYENLNFPRLLFFCKFLLNHQNLFNNNQMSYTEYFKDDPLYINKRNENELMIESNENFYFEFIYKNQLMINYEKFGLNNNNYFCDEQKRVVIESKVRKNNL